MSRAQDRLTPRSRDLGALILGAITGASAWISLGVLAVTNNSLARVGVLPPLWALAACSAAGLLGAWVIRLRTAEAWPLALTFLLWLPWLPLPLFSALTIWDGPLEPAVWMMAGGGVMFARWWPTREQLLWAGDRRRTPVVIGAVFFAISLATAAALSERIPGGDEPHYLIIAQSLLKDGDLRIQNNHDRGDCLAYSDKGLPPDFRKRGLDGQIYSVHAPGVAVLILPVFAIAGYPGSIVLVALLVAVALASNWRVALDLSGNAPSAWAGALAVGASATVFLHSFSIFPDPVGWAAVSAAVALLMRLALAPATVRTWRVAATGLVIGALPWLHTRFSVIAAALGVVFVGRLWARADRWRKLTAFAAAPALLAIGWFGYFWIIYGTIDPTAPYGAAQQSSLLWAGRGLVGLAFDQEFGLIANAPVLGLLPFGWWQLFRQNRRLALEFLLITVPYTVVVASFGMWWGGWSAPARFLDAVMPIAVPLMALGWRDGNRAVRSAFVALLLLGVTNIVMRIVVMDGLLLYNDRDGYDLLLDWVSRAVNLPLAFPAVHRKGGVLAMVLASIWLAAGLLALTILTAVLSKPRSRGAQYALTACVGLSAATLASFASWRVSVSVEVTPQTSQVSFLRRWQPELRPLAIELPGVRRLGATSLLGRIAISSSPRPREANPEPTLLNVAWLPAGEYQIVFDGDRELAGTVTASVGTTSETVETWPLAGLTSGGAALHVTLPALARSLVIRGDDEARRRISHVALRPLAVRFGLDRYGEYIIRAARYQQVRVFLLNDDAYVEPAGLWTRGNSTARLAIASDEERVPIDFQAGPVATTVRLTSGEWTSESSLSPGKRRRVDVPAKGVLTVESTGTFRPVDHDPATRDARALGVRLEFPHG